MVEMPLIIGFVAGTLAIDSSGQLVGCENDPCQHLCVDTIDSYICQCHENFVLQPDGHSCLREYANLL